MFPETLSFQDERGWFISNVSSERYYHAKSHYFELYRCIYEVRSPGGLLLLNPAHLVKSELSEAVKMVSPMPETADKQMKICKKCQLPTPSALMRPDGRCDACSGESG